MLKFRIVKKVCLPAEAPGSSCKQRKAQKQADYQKEKKRKANARRNQLLRATGISRRNPELFKSLKIHYTPLKPEYLRRTITSYTGLTGDGPQSSPLGGVGGSGSSTNTDFLHPLCDKDVRFLVKRKGYLYIPNNEGYVYFIYKYVASLNFFRWQGC